MTDRPLTFSEGCEFLRVCEKTAQRRLKDPTTDFPRPFKMGGRWFFLQSRLDHYVQTKARAAEGVPSNLSEPAQPEAALAWPRHG
jgi:predicted DNA-binding transcriptional regulator AlpA